MNAGDVWVVFDVRGAPVAVYDSAEAAAIVAASSPGPRKWIVVHYTKARAKP